MEPIHIVLATDENYAQHAGVTIASILHTKKASDPIIFYIIEDELSISTRSKLETIVKNYEASVFFLNVGSGIFNDLPVINHLSRTAYYRLAITEILPADVNKALYLDTDMIVRSDITKLWHTDITQYFAAAVNDIGINALDRKVRLRKSLGIPETEPYFNSGLLLINLIKWREYDIGEKVIQFISENKSKLHFCDQDGLNAILWGKWLPLHPKWNVYRMLFRKYYTWNERQTLAPDLAEAVQNPSIVHFTGAVKPWHCGCYIPYVEEYYKYLAMTPWKNYCPPSPSMHALLKQYRWRIRRRIFDYAYKKLGL